MNKSGTLDKKELARVFQAAHPQQVTEEQAAAIVDLVIHKGTEHRLGPISKCIMGCFNAEKKKELDEQQSKKADIGFEEYMPM